MYGVISFRSQCRVFGAQGVFSELRGGFAGVRRSGLYSPVAMATSILAAARQRSRNAALGASVSAITQGLVAAATKRTFMAPRSGLGAANVLRRVCGPIWGRVDVVRAFIDPKVRLCLLTCLVAVVVCAVCGVEAVVVLRAGLYSEHL